MKKILQWLLASGSVAPVQFKGGVFEKIFTKFLMRYRKLYIDDHNIRSNLGINNRLKVALSIQQAPSIFFFGKPLSYKGEYYTVQLVSFLTRYCSAFIDIGANWGFYSYYISSANSSLPIYWFEPNLALHDSIIANTALNGLQNITGSQLAVSDTNGKLSFYVEEGAGFNSSLIKPPTEQDISEVTVDAIRFEDWVRQTGVNKGLLVKVDVENAEWNFIKGASQALDKIEFLVMEVLGPARQSGFINYMIGELKMEAYYINEARLEHVLQEDMRYTPGEYNWLFCRRSPDKLKQQMAGSIFTVVE